MYNVFFPQIYDLERKDIYAVSLMIFYLHSGVVQLYISSQKINRARFYLVINFFLTNYTLTRIGIWVTLVFFRVLPTEPINR